MTCPSAGVRAFAPVVLVSVTALTLAGCGAGERGSDGASPSARTSSRSAAPSPTPRQAADGTKLSACEDGTCEVTVTGRARIPVNRKSGLASLKVRSITSGEIRLTGIAASTPTGYSFATSCGGDASCSTSVDNDKADVTARAGAEITLNRLLIRVTSIAGGSAILRLSRA
ncbi:hypothetical protein OG417_22315 [Actinoallomurus sp. NBC_01490]|uniref:hypothetical protein n=1 Tax=Actinoallomurus sp. NBC_01490 TaxID=2903557 RepID=UPI002E320A2E|nr:hypothetical protein [Actinoallomurus sp. NBC_01490]